MIATLLKENKNYYKLNGSNQIFKIFIKNKDLQKFFFHILMSIFNLNAFLCYFVGSP